GPSMPSWSRSFGRALVDLLRRAVRQRNFEGLDGVRSLDHCAVLWAVQVNGVGVPSRQVGFAPLTLPALPFDNQDATGYGLDLASISPLAHVGVELLSRLGIDGPGIESGAVVAGEGRPGRPRDDTARPVAGVGICSVVLPYTGDP